MNVRWERSYKEGEGGVKVRVRWERSWKVYVPLLRLITGGPWIILMQLNTKFRYPSRLVFFHQS